MAEHQERNKYLNRSVYNDWGLYAFMQMLIYSAIRSLETATSGGRAAKKTLTTISLTLGEIPNHLNGRMIAIPPKWRLVLKAAKRGTE